jgi:hypothetical protein
MLISIEQMVIWLPVERHEGVKNQDEQSEGSYPLHVNAGR